jgi:predicted ATP-dependent endonuclease of OLD family
LGQAEDYYENIAKLGDEKRKQILVAMQDVAYNLEIFNKYEEERVMRISLLRSITPFTVRLQFNRMANGGARLTSYNFTYCPPSNEIDQTTRTHEISFSVEPDSNPPTNVHVLIGRNGTGKTSLIKNMIHSVRGSDSSHGTFQYEGRIRTRAEFANVLCVAFSPFDDFSELDSIESAIPYSYIGLNKTSTDLLQTIERQFLESFTGCMVNARKRKLWLDAIEVLKSDPTFVEVHIESLVENMPGCVSESSSADGQEEIKRTFSKLSSGHKVVLLIITCCVNKIEEKSIVFLDEPENHLHPPLLSALIRALSELLIDRNGVAVVSTHSPVVLQEVPSSCV